jgi:hypothetical protein
MKKKSRTGDLKAKDIKRLLKRYDCPMPYHAVRARFLGCIACPSIDTHPMQALAALWDGAMPEIENIEDANELMQGLVNGVWNPLTLLLSGNKEFRLTRMRGPSDKAGLKRFAQTRINEIDAFVDGLFGGEEAIDLPDTAHEAVEALSELASFFEAFVQFGDEPYTEVEFGEAVLNARKLSYIAEQEINETVRACTKARHAALSRLGDGRPTLH